MKSEESKLEVLRQYRKSGNLQDEEATEDTLEVHEFQTEVARVRYGLSKTINLGNYESFKISVEVELPCYKEEVEAAKERAFEIAEEELMRNVKEVEEIL